jgi:hypothetical protein
VIDGLARPRVGIVLPGGLDAREFALAARVATLAVLDRVPRARVAVLVASGKLPPASGWDCGRPPRKLVAADRESFDVLVVVGARVSGVRVGEVRDMLGIAGRVGAEEFWENRRGVLRLLGWDEIPDAAGPDELIVQNRTSLEQSRVSSSLRDFPPSLRTNEPHVSSFFLRTNETLREAESSADAERILAAFDEAARTAISTWHDRGSPGAIPDPAPARRAATQHAALRVELRMLERDIESAEQRVTNAEEAARLITGSRTWRYTERLRTAYHQTRGRLKR